jgi:hypothetical protein
MQDQLIYEVVLKANEASVKAVQDQLNAITMKSAQALKEAQLGAAGGETARIAELEKVKKANEGNLKSLIDLQKQQGEYRADLKVLAVQEQIQGELTEEQAQRQQELKLALKAAGSAYNAQQRDIIATSSVTEGLGRTYDELVAQNKALSIQMRGLPLNDTTGKLKELQSQYNENNNVLKQFDKSMGNNQRNVGNYADAVTGLGGQLSNVKGPIGGVGTAFTGLNTVMKASPIGLISMLAVQLVASLSKVQVVTDTLNAVFAGLSATLNVVGARLASFGSGMISILKGDFSKGIDLITGSFSGLATEIIDVVKAGTQAEQMLQNIRRQENTALVTQARLTRDIANARLEAKDAELDPEERLAAINKAIELNNQLATSERSIASARVEAARTKLRTDSDDIELQTALAQARAELIRVDENLSNRQRELFEQRTTLSRLVVSEEQKAAQERLAIERNFQESIKAINTGFTATVQANRVAERNQLISDEAEKLRIYKQSAAEQLEIDRLTAEQRKALTKTVYESSFAIANAFFGKFKAISIAQAIVDTIGASISAFKSTNGGIFAKSLAAAAALAKGYAQVRQMTAVRPGSSARSSSGSSVASASVPTSVSTTDTVISGRNATSTASSLSPFGGNQPILIEANLDRKGLALAVRQGENQIKSEQITFST